MASQAFLGNKIRRLRKDAALTQVQLAERCGMPQSTISRIESGSTSGVDFETLDKVADALGVHPADLIAFNEVVFDHKGRTYVVNDITREVETVPEGATTVWAVRGTRLTFPTGAGTTPSQVIRKAKKLLTEPI